MAINLYLMRIKLLPTKVHFSRMRTVKNERRKRSAYYYYGKAHFRVKKNAFYVTESMIYLNYSNIRNINNQSSKFRILHKYQINISQKTNAYHFFSPQDKQELFSQMLKNII